MNRHDQDLRDAFDGQAEGFERSPVTADPAALERLVAFAAPPPGARVLDAGCGPGLVSEAFLAAGHSVHGVDLSPEMIARARSRCARFGAGAVFEQRSLFELTPGRPFDAAVSRYVVHHVEDPLAFVRRQAALLRPGGVLLVCDLTTDPDPARRRWHQEVERARDRTHTRHLTPGALVELLAAQGLGELRACEERLELDFDEWFDRGTPSAPKSEVRARILAGAARGFTPELLPGGAIRIAAWRALVRGVRPG
ncbi:MAG TPA: methyltransferase domain-containing protein [Anaeromyxobacter sp.]|nr:methyltransferase domain-containing protein [Anaeromyxobacter sp.]